MMILVNECGAHQILALECQKIYEWKLSCESVAKKELC